VGLCPVARRLHTLQSNNKNQNNNKYKTQLPQHEECHGRVALIVESLKTATSVQKVIDKGRIEPPRHLIQCFWGPQESYTAVAAQTARTTDCPRLTDRHWDLRSQQSTSQY